LVPPKNNAGLGKESKSELRSSKGNDRKEKAEKKEKVTVP